MHRGSSRMTPLRPLSSEHLHSPPHTHGALGSLHSHGGGLSPSPSYESFGAAHGYTVNAGAAQLRGNPFGFHAGSTGDLTAMMSVGQAGPPPTLRVGGSSIITLPPLLPTTSTTTATGGSGERSHVARHNSRAVLDIAVPWCLAEQEEEAAAERAALAAAVVGATGAAHQETAVRAASAAAAKCNCHSFTTEKDVDGADSAAGAPPPPPQLMQQQTRLYSRGALPESFRVAATQAASTSAVPAITTATTTSSPHGVHGAAVIQRSVSGRRADGSGASAPATPAMGAHGFSQTVRSVDDEGGSLGPDDGAPRGTAGTIDEVEDEDDGDRDVEGDDGDRARSEDDDGGGGTAGGGGTDFDDDGANDEDGGETIGDLPPNLKYAPASRGGGGGGVAVGGRRLVRAASDAASVFSFGGDGDGFGNEEHELTRRAPRHVMAAVQTPSRSDGIGGRGPARGAGSRSAHVEVAVRSGEASQAPVHAPGGVQRPARPSSPTASSSVAAAAQPGDARVAPSHAETPQRHQPQQTAPSTAVATAVAAFAGTRASQLARRRPDATAPSRALTVARPQLALPAPLAGLTHFNAAAFAALQKQRSALQSMMAKGAASGSRLDADGVASSRALSIHSGHVLVCGANDKVRAPHAVVAAVHAPVSLTRLDRRLAPFTRRHPKPSPAARPPASCAAHATPCRAGARDLGHGPRDRRRAARAGARCDDVDARVHLRRRAVPHLRAAVGRRGQRDARGLIAVVGARLLGQR